MTIVGLTLFFLAGLTVLVEAETPEPVTTTRWEEPGEVLYLHMTPAHRAQRLVPRSTMSGRVYITRMEPEDYEVSDQYFADVRRQKATYPNQVVSANLYEKLYPGDTVILHLRKDETASQIGTFIELVTLPKTGTMEPPPNPR